MQGSLSVCVSVSRPALPRAARRVSSRASVPNAFKLATPRATVRPAFVTRLVAQASSDADMSSKVTTAGGHAAMHDFCLTLPYGALVAVGGVMGGLLKGSMMSLAMGGGIGSLLMVLGGLSLNNWKSGGSNVPYTGASALLAGGVTYAMGKRFLATGAVFPAGIVAGLSAIMLLFYLYNIAAGGNPPKKKASA